jgi:hypothetical protein
MRKLFGMNKKSNEVKVNKIDEVIEKLRDTEDMNNPFAIEKHEGFEVIEVRYIRDENGNWVAKDIIEVQADFGMTNEGESDIELPDDFGMTIED